MILNLNSKAELVDLINNNDSGVIRTYLVNASFRNKLDKIIFVSNKLISIRNVVPFIEVKYNFGRRNKRIEIVFKDKNELNLCKITNTNEFDKDYFDLLSVLTDINENYPNHTLKGVLIFIDDYKKELVESFLRNQNLYFEHTNINEIQQ
jgi:hypothetical protein